VRKTPVSGRYIPELDGVRAVAVTLVLLFHCVIVPEHGVVAAILRHILSKGWVGVDLFFVLSGYLIVSILLRAKSRPHYFRNFYARRFLRISPLYYAVIAIVVSYAHWFPAGTLHPFWPYLTYTTNLWVVFGGRAQFGPLAHTWTLAVEEQFYLLFPILVFRLEKTRLRHLLWAALALLLGVRALANAYGSDGFALAANICRFDGLALGALIAIEFDGRTEISDLAVRRLRLAAFSLAALTVLLWLTRQYDSVFVNVGSLTIINLTEAAFVCVVLVAPGRQLSHLLRLPAAVGIGRISYGIYLIHYPILKIVEVQAGTRLADSWLRTLVVATTSIGATLVVAVFSWFGFERPILRLKKWFYEPGEDASRVETAMIELPLAVALQNIDDLPE
jgi:peptidoglycan/LPS O-acetylase OafA/YrhL